MVVKVSFYRLCTQMTVRSSESRVESDGCFAVSRHRSRSILMKKQSRQVLGDLCGLYSFARYSKKCLFHSNV